MMSDFLAHFLTYLPTPVRFRPYINFYFYYMVSDFDKPTYLPKNQTSFMEVPLSGQGLILKWAKGGIQILIDRKSGWANFEAYKMNDIFLFTSFVNRRG